MRTGCVVALKFIVNFSWGLQFFLQAVGPHQRRRTIHLVKIADFLRNIKVSRIIVQLLLHQLPAEYLLQLSRRHRLQSARVQQRRRLVLHIRPQIIPLLRHLIFRQINFVRDLVFSHFSLLLFYYIWGRKHYILKDSICLMSNGCVHTKLLLRLSLCSGLQIAKCSLMFPFA